MISAAIDPSHLKTWAEALNQALARYSDKDWSYSRIRIQVCDLSEQPSAYVLEVDWLDVQGKQAQTVLKNLKGEMTWGERHSYELGILEVISLRLNRALMEVTSDAHWNNVRPVFRLARRGELLEKGRTHAFWYQVTEVEGEEFENR